MSDIILRLSETEHMQFLKKVGKGNMAPSLRQYVRAMIEKNDDITDSIKQRRFQELDKQKKKLDAEYAEAKAEVEAINNANEAERIKSEEAFEAERKKMADIKHDTLKANLSRMV